MAPPIPNAFQTDLQVERREKEKRKKREKKGPPDPPKAVAATPSLPPTPWVMLIWMMGIKLERKKNKK